MMTALFIGSAIVLLIIWPISILVFAARSYHRGKAEVFEAFIPMIESQKNQLIYFGGTYKKLEREVPDKGQVSIWTFDGGKNWYLTDREGIILGLADESILRHFEKDIGESHGLVSSSFLRLDLDS